MKQFVQLSIFVCAVLLGFTACQKDYDPTPDVFKHPTPNIFNGAISFTLDSGFHFVSEVQQASVSENNGMKTVSISGTRFDDSRREGIYKTVSITIGNYSGAKKYQVPSEAIIYYVDSRPDGSISTYISTSFNADYHVTTTGDYQGTFAATLIDQNNPNNKIEINNGKFDLKP